MLFCHLTDVTIFQIWRQYWNDECTEIFWLKKIPLQIVRPRFKIGVSAEKPHQIWFCKCTLRHTTLIHLMSCHSLWYQLGCRVPLCLICARCFRFSSTAKNHFRRELNLSCGRSTLYWLAYHLLMFWRLKKSEICPINFRAMSFLVFYRSNLTNTVNWIKIY